MSDPTTHSSDDTLPAAPGKSRGVDWRLPLVLLLLLVAIVVVRASRDQTRVVEPDPSAAPPPVAADGKAVALAIDFGDGRKREFTEIAWQPGMTVDDLLTAASRLPDGIRYAVNGEGEMMWLDSINGVANELGGGRNWLYHVNDKFADRSMGIYELEPGDRVLWTFGEKE